MKQSKNDRGAVLIHVVAALLALIAFSTFVMDYGVYWTARRQAQNAADAGAHAGAVTLAFDDPTDASGVVAQSAQQEAQSNAIWGQSPSVVAATDVHVPSGGFKCPDGTSTCVRVDVYRTAARSNELPIFFGRLAGVTSQDVRATATAQVLVANASKCMKPWAVADKWQENNPVIGAQWTTGSTFDDTGGHPDVYVPQDGNGNPGTGFTLANDYGTQITLKVGSPSDTNAQIVPGWFQAVDIGGTGAKNYEDAIAGCASVIVGIGDTLATENGNMVGPTNTGVTGSANGHNPCDPGGLIDLDCSARWDPNAGANGKGAIVNSCVGPPYTCSVAGYTESPRIVAIPVFNLKTFIDTGGPGKGTVVITNILGFFVDSVDASGDVVGYLVSKPDLYVASKGGISGASSFARMVNIIR